jgi:hypothetical protein
VASLVTQSHWDVRLPTDEIKPTSLFLITIVGSGERKTATDKRAKAVIDAWEVTQSEKWRLAKREWDDENDAYEAMRKQILNDKKTYADQEDKRRALQGLTQPEPVPAVPILICSNPTIEGLWKLLREGPGYGGVFTDEGGTWVGSHAMSADSKLRTISGFNQLFDGTSLKRVVSTDDLKALHGRRIAMHLLVQPIVADLFFGDPILDGLGFLSRILAAMPDELAGLRPKFNPADVQNLSNLSRFSGAVSMFLEKPLGASDKDPRELRPSVLEMSPEATAGWIAFNDRVEREKGPNGKYGPIKRLANKASEQAARLAAVIDRFGAIVAARPADKLPGAAMEAGIALMEQYYLPEALRVYASVQDSPDLALAEKTSAWARSLPEKKFSLPDLYQLGPYAVRDAEKARQLIQILLSHRHIVQIPGGAVIRGTKRREAYQVVPDPQQSIFIKSKEGSAKAANNANPASNGSSTSAGLAGLADPLRAAEQNTSPQNHDADGEVL